jgi:hypothetical protein
MTTSHNHSPFRALNAAEPDHQGGGATFACSHSPELNPCLSAGLEYLARGWSALWLCPPDHVGVHPRHLNICTRPGKQPLGRWKHCQQRRLSSEQLARWAALCPAGNVGIVLGRVSELAGLDIDGPEAEQILQEISGGDVPLTLSFPTPGRGLRLLYSLPEGVKVPKRRFDRGESHVIVLGEGSLTVMPPSRHKCGQVYEGFSLSAPLAPAPAWLLQLENGHRETHYSSPSPPTSEAGLSVLERAKRYVAKCPPAISGQGGHDATLFVACRLIKGFGLSPDEALSLLLHEYNPRCVPPWSEKELRHKVEDAGKRPGEERFKMIGHTSSGSTARTKNATSDKSSSCGDSKKEQEVRKPGSEDSSVSSDSSAHYPLQSLPPAVAQLAQEGAWALGCDPSMIATHALAVLAGAIGNSLVARLKESWYAACALWTAVIARSGACKSPAYHLAVDPVFRLQWEFVQAKDLRVLFSSDATVECLAGLLSENPRGLLFTRDEMSAWLGSFKRYSKSREATDRPHWLEYYDGRPHSRHRKTDKERLFVPRPLVSLTGTFQPAVFYAAVSAEDFASGLTPRLLLAWPKDVKRQWSDRVVAETTIKGYDDLIRHLYTIPCDEQPRAVTLESQARQATVDFVNAWGERAFVSSERWQPILAKLEGTMGRLALVLAACRDPEKPQIQEADVRHAVALVEWYAHEWEKVLRLLAGQDEQTETDRVLEIVEAAGGRMTARELQKNHASRYPTTEDAQRALRLLVPRYAEEQEVRHGPKGGRPTTVFVLKSCKKEPTKPTDPPSST